MLIMVCTVLGTHHKISRKTPRRIEINSINFQKKVQLSERVHNFQFDFKIKLFTLVLNVSSMESKYDSI